MIGKFAYVIMFNLHIDPSSVPQNVLLTLFVVELNKRNILGSILATILCKW
jgi:hypothetical protein